MVSVINLTNCRNISDKREMEDIAGNTSLGFFDIEVSICEDYVKYIFFFFIIPGLRKIQNIISTTCVAKGLLYKQCRNYFV